MLCDKVRNGPCLICNMKATDVHHLKSRGSFGDDVEHNLVGLCRACHTLIHSKGIATIAKTFIHFKEWLEAHNWFYCDTLKTWRHE
jgi:hypothetical protein